MHGKSTSLWALLIDGILPLTACNDASDVEPAPSAKEAHPFATKSCLKLSDQPVRIEGGSFVMGNDAVYPREEGPPRETTVEGFWIDPHEVTNGQFAEFVDATGYATVAERPVDPAQFGVPVEQIPAFMLEPGSAVFKPPARPSNNYTDWWEYLPGASWKKPYGPDGSDAVADQPVVHLAWQDMLAYASWKGGRIPTALSD